MRRLRRASERERTVAAEKVAAEKGAAEKDVDEKAAAEKDAAVKGAEEASTSWCGRRSGQQAKEIKSVELWS